MRKALLFTVVCVFVLLLGLVVSPWMGRGPTLCLGGVVLSLGATLYFLLRTAAALQASPAPQEELSAHRRRELQREYQTLKRSLREVELDYLSGKYTEEDYAFVRGAYRERAIHILQTLDRPIDVYEQIETDLKIRQKLGQTSPEGL